jgi:hypothetical protein
MSKPLDEYALPNFEGLEVVSSSLVLKLSGNISSVLHLTFALMYTYCHCFVALRLKFVELSDASEQGNQSPLCFEPARLVLGQEQVYLDELVQSVSSLACSCATLSP